MPAVVPVDSSATLKFSVCCSATLVRACFGNIKQCAQLYLLAIHKRCCLSSNQMSIAATYNIHTKQQTCNVTVCDQDSCERWIGV
eukprot:19300-Heterococcus_DN1.PRE.2